MYTTEHTFLDTDKKEYVEIKDLVNEFRNTHPSNPKHNFLRNKITHLCNYYSNEGIISTKEKNNLYLATVEASGESANVDAVPVLLEFNKYLTKGVFILSSLDLYSILNVKSRTDKFIPLGQKGVIEQLTSNYNRFTNCLKLAQECDVDTGNVYEILDLLFLNLLPLVSNVEYMDRAKILVGIYKDISSKVIERDKQYYKSTPDYTHGWDNLEHDYFDIVADDENQYIDYYTEKCRCELRFRLLDNDVTETTFREILDKLDKVDLNIDNLDVARITLYNYTDEIFNKDKIDIILSYKGVEKSEYFSYVDPQLLLETTIYALKFSQYFDRDSLIDYAIKVAKIETITEDGVIDPDKSFRMAMRHYVNLFEVYGVITKDETDEIMKIVEGRTDYENK